MQYELPWDLAAWTKWLAREEGTTLCNSNYELLL